MYKILTILILVSLTGITSISYAQQGYRSQAGPAERGRLFPGIPDLTEEEKELFLNAEQWPDSLFEKLEEFIIKG